ncbi:MAG: hypothetical protein JRF63_03750, partial [Deltaproteobacteria bacterium]|nr:hypothetical protein [Deltaproteobacteria bacterium]
MLVMNQVVKVLLAAQEAGGGGGGGGGSAPVIAGSLSEMVRLATEAS